MRIYGLAAAIVLSIGACGVAAAASVNQTSPSVADCVRAWNAAPVLKTTHSTRPAAVSAVASHSFRVTFTKSAKASLTGPGCIVTVAQAKNHLLLIQGKWKTENHVAWRKAVVMMSGLTKTNAVIGSNGQLTLR